jgi:hypothetical protein
MTGPRLLGFIGAGAFAGGWLARAAFDWGLGLPLVLFLALVLAAAAAGGLVGYAAARDEAPLDGRLVAIAVPGGILGAASFFAPFPFGIAATALVVLTSLWLLARRSARA